MKKRVKNKRLSVLFIWMIIFSLFPAITPGMAVENKEMKSPIVHEDGKVTFHYNESANISRVRVAGNFTDWQNGAKEMEEENGIWSITTEPLIPNVYQYKFILDEENWIQDPLNESKMGDNSQFVVPGINLDQVPVFVEQNSKIQLKADVINQDGDKTEESSSIEWFLEDAPEGVEIKDENLIISSKVGAETVFSITAKKGSFETTKEITVSEKMNGYTVHYHRTDNNLNDWKLHIFDGGFDPGDYLFENTYTVQHGNEEYTFAKGTYAFPGESITLIPKMGDWDSQDTDWTVQLHKGEKEAEAWIVQGYPEVFTSEDEALSALSTSVPPHIQFVYDRPDQDYTDWDVWVWGTGAKDDNIDFTTFEDGKAIAQIGVSPKTDRVGFKVRKGDWEAEEPGGDRYIPINKLDSITKVYVKSGDVNIHTVPELEKPSTKNGNATFYFRDPALYLKNEMNKIDKVELALLNKRFEMEKDEKNERFMFTYENLPTGDHPYSFFVTIEGETKEVADPYFSIDGKSIISYKHTEMDIAGSVFPKEIDYNENALLTLTIKQQSVDEIKELYVDLSEIGGEKHTSIDPHLQEITIGVDSSTTAGVKKLPLTAIDLYGNEHDGEAEITVKARKSVGEGDFDWDEARIYFMLTDRFFNGDTSNDDPYGIGYDKNDPGAYQGGDFKGITKKLDYLEELGINTIWISPIVENIAHDVRFTDDPHLTPYYGYHGYWASNFSELNPHFGTMEDLHELIDEAHARGIKLMVDVVLNHGGYGLKESEATLQAAIPHFPTDEDRERFSGMFRNGGSGEVQGELAGLPDFITEDPKVREQLIEWQAEWIEKSKTPKGNTIDYFRVDTVKHVENTTWMAFKNALTSELPTFKLIGEAWGASQFNDYGYLNAGMMDSLLDFDFKYQARDFVNGKINAVEENLKKRSEIISNTASLGQFLGSHDEDGFLQQFKDDENKLGKLMLAASLQVTAKGQPVIYYGEELGLSGDNNYPYQDNRPNFPWKQVEGNEVLAHYTKILNVRKEYSSVFSKGTRKQIAGSDELGYSIFERSYDDQSVIVGLNTKTNSVNLDITVPFKEGETVIDMYSGKTAIVTDNQTVSFTLPEISDGGTVLLALEGSAEEPTVQIPEDGDNPSESEKPSPEDPIIDDGDPAGENSIDKDGSTDDEAVVSEHENTSTPNDYTNKEKGAKLPKTATTMHRMLLLGIVLLVMGGCVLAVRKNRVK